MAESPSILDLFLAFLRNPTKENYARARLALVSAPSYRPYSDELEQAGTHVNEGRYREATEVICDAWNNLLLSPWAHLLLAQASEKLGDQRAREMERVIASVCLHGILGTGDGSRRYPYMLTRISDEYDVLRALKKGLREQALLQVAGRWFDRLKCDDGSEIWFDITDAKKTLRRSLFSDEP